MGKQAELFDSIEKTFGIEVEFCTHDSEILSFTHIEPCTIIHQEQEWKIETDADYTLELVSPILMFEDHKKANEFKTSLMATLDTIVRSKPTLGECVKKISEFLGNQKQIKYLSSDQEQKEKLNKKSEVSIKYIQKKELIKELDYHNWDSDTNLERVIAQKREIDIDTSFNDEKVAEYLKSIILSPSKKHGGLPSSQLNHPMSLRTYVWYSAFIKETRAWIRVLASSKENFQSDWREKKRESIKKQYGHLTDTWKKRYLNDDYMDQRQDEKIPIWHRYWFWLVSIREITYKHQFKIAKKPLGNNYFQKVKDIVKQIPLSHPLPDNSDQVWEEEEYKKLLDTIYKYETGIFVNEEASPIEENLSNLPQHLYSAMYVTIHKLVSGALGVLSESEQSKLQKIIFDMQGELDDEDVLKSCVANPEFLQFHYALKDLTPLWFKGALGDVLRSFSQEDIKQIQTFLTDLKSEDVEEILNNNLKFLGRIYVVNEYFNHGNAYDWDEFKEDLLPSVSGFVRQFAKGQQQLVNVLKNQEIRYYTYEALAKKTQNNKFLDREKVPAWEGRWDTIKPPMKSEFLVEHRNN